MMEANIGSEFCKWATAFFMDAPSNLSTSGPGLHQVDRPPAEEFSLFRTFTRHLRESIRHYGFFNTASQLLTELHRLVADQLPHRKREKYDDLEFDWEHSVDTTRANLSFRLQFINALIGHEYWPTEPGMFAQMMKELPLGFKDRDDFKDFTFIDLGSGKGRILMMAAGYSFRRIVGVEFVPELHEIALKNIAIYGKDHEGCERIEPLCVDARDFQFPLEPLVIFLFNPFPEPVFASVLENLRLSLERETRPVYIAYRYLEMEHLLEDCDWLMTVAGTEEWAIYKNTSGKKKEKQQEP